jgi:hypothetical protein
MIRITPAVKECRLTNRLRPTANGCEADVTYTHTSLGPQGDAFVASFTEESFHRSMQVWKEGLDHYLRHGTALPAAAK